MTNAQIIQQYYIAYYGRPADPDGLTFWLDELAQGAPITQLVSQFGSSSQPEFDAIYGSAATIEAFFTAAYSNMLNREPDQAGLQFWLGAYDREIAKGKTEDEARADLIIEFINGIDGGGVRDKNTWANQIALAEQVTEAASTLEGADISALINFARDGFFLDGDIGAPSIFASAQQAVQDFYTTLQTSDVVMLTAAVDVKTGNVFSSMPAFTPGGNDLVNTLQDEDVLTGVGVNPTLNVTLGSVNDAAESFINPILNGIETINLAVTSGNVTGLGLEEATGTKAMNITRITANQQDFVIESLAESVDTLSVTNATRGADVEFNFRDDAGAVLEDVLNITLANVRLDELDITRTGSLADQHDTVNLNTAGPVVEVDDFFLFGDNNPATAQTLNLNAGAVGTAFDNFNAGSVTDMNLVADGETLIEDLNAASLTALSIEANETVVIEDQATAELRSITITGSADVDLLGVQGNTDLEDGGVTVDSTGLASTGRLLAALYEVSGAANTVVNTGAGNDILLTGALGGTINAGAGNNIVIAGLVGEDNELVQTFNLLSTGSVSAGDGNNLVVGRDMNALGDDISQLTSTNLVDSAASITLGDGNNIVSVRDMESAASWEDWDTLDANVDDTFVLVGASITAGDGNNTVSLRSMEENAVIDLGNGANTVTFEDFGLTGGTVLAADTLNPRERVDLSSPEAAEDTLGAQVYLGNGGNTVNFNDTAWEGEDDDNTDVLFVGEGAVLSAGTGADTINVNFINDVDVVAGATEDFNDALISGFETINLTALKAGVDGEDELVENLASVILDVQRVDGDLETINMVSLEDVTLVNTGVAVGQESEFYVRGNQTSFTLENLREEVEVNLSAQEASGVSDGDLEDDHVADVFLEVDMVDASGTDDTFTLNIANSGSFDLDLTVGASSFPVGEDRDEDNAYETENVVINLNTNSHTFYFNDFGAGYQNDTSLTINGTAAGKDIVLNHVNANVITVNGAGNVTLEMVDSNDSAYVTDADSAKLLQVTTGSGDDHVHVSAFSLAVEDSFVNLGTGTNTIGINGLTDLAASGEDSDADALESFAGLDISGSMYRVELLDDFQIDRAVTLDLSGFDTDVTELYVGDLYGGATAEDSQNDLTITGMSGDVLIQSGYDLVLESNPVSVDGEDAQAENAGRLTIEGATSITIEAGVDHGERTADGAGTWVEGRAGTWADGEFTLVDGFNDNGDSAAVEFNLGTGNSVLSSLNVAAGDDVDVWISDNDGSVAFNIGEINLFSGGLGENGNADLLIVVNVGTAITIGNINGFAEETEVDIVNNVEGAEITIGAVNLVGIDEDFIGIDDDGADSGSATLNIDDNIDSTITIGLDGGVTLTGSDDADINIDDNIRSTIILGDVTLLSGDDADIDIDRNIGSTILLGAVSITGEDSTIDLNVDDNINTNITFDSVSMVSTEGGSIDFKIDDNLLQDEVDIDGETEALIVENDMFIIVNKGITLEADSSVEFVIENNEDRSVERDLVIDLKGAVVLNSLDGSAEFDIDDNIDTTIHIRSTVSITAGGEDDDADLDVDFNDDSTIRFYDAVTVAATGEDGDADVDLHDNDDASIRFDSLVTITSDDGDVGLRIFDNDSASVRLLGGVELEAGDDADIAITNNDDGTVVISGITATSSIDGNVNMVIADNDFAIVRTGDVSLTAEAGQVADLGVLDNDFTEVTLGTVDMEAGATFFTVGGGFFFGGEDNFDSTIEVGDVTMTAVGGEDFGFFGPFDAVFSVFGDDSDIDVGDVTIHADGGAIFFAVGEDTADIDIGDVYVRAGAQLDEDGEWIDSLTDSAFVAFVMGNVGTTETIHLQTNGGEDSDIQALIFDTPDLHTITLVGGEGDGLLDLGLGMGMGGFFGLGGGEDSFLGVFGEQGDLDGVFTIDMSDLTADILVYTVVNVGDLVDSEATFDPGTVVNVLIGSGATYYNVELVGEDTLFTGSEAGLVSTGVRDLTPEVLSKTFGLGNGGGIQDGESGTYTFNIELNGQSYAASVTIADPTGVDPIGYSFNLPTLPTGYALNASGSTFTLTGPSSGAGSASITTAVKTSGNGNGTIEFATTGNDGTMISDGRGLEEREIFTFTGDDIGDVVIGGFNPGSWNSISPINGQITDRLDFSQFASVDSLDDMIFDIDLSGPVANVVIDFVDESLGSITLVGVGEYDNAIVLVQDSILFG